MEEMYKTLRALALDMENNLRRGRHDVLSMQFSILLANIEDLRIETPIPEPTTPQP